MTPPYNCWCGEITTFCWFISVCWCVLNHSRYSSPRLLNYHGGPFIDLHRMLLNKTHTPLFANHGGHDFIFNSKYWVKCQQAHLHCDMHRPPSEGQIKVLVLRAVSKAPPYLHAVLSPNSNYVLDKTQRLTEKTELQLDRSGVSASEKWEWSSDWASTVLN